MGLNTVLLIDTTVTFAFCRFASSSSIGILLAATGSLATRKSAALSELFLSL